MIDIVYFFVAVNSCCFYSLSLQRFSFYHVKICTHNVQFIQQLRWSSGRCRRVILLLRLFCCQPETACWFATSRARWDKDLSQGGRRWWYSLYGSLTLTMAAKPSEFVWFNTVTLWTYAVIWCMNICITDIAFKWLVDWPHYCSNSEKKLIRIHTCYGKILKNKFIHYVNDNRSKTPKNHRKVTLPPPPHRLSVNVSPFLSFLLFLIRHH